MKLQNQHNSHLANQAPLRDSRTARFDLPVRHPALWRFLFDQLLRPALRLHNYRHLSMRMLEDTLDELNCETC